MELLRKIRNECFDSLDLSGKRVIMPCFALYLS